LVLVLCLYFFDVSTCSEFAAALLTFAYIVYCHRHNCHMGHHDRISP
jgi:hypothetical protein